MRFANIIMTYLIIGLVMFGGGAISWDDSGASEFFLTGGENQSQPQLNPDISQEMENSGGVINNLVTAFSGTLLIVWNLIVGLITYLNWPVAVLASNNAPPIATALLGGSLSASFYLSAIQLWRT